MPYQYSWWWEVFYQDDNNVPRTVTFDLGVGGKDFLAQASLSSVWFGTRTPTTGYGVAADIIDIDGAATPITFTFGASPPVDRSTHVAIAYPGTIGDITGRRVTFRVRGTTFDAAAVATCHILIRS
jgi:hypothetical protein